MKRISADMIFAATLMISAPYFAPYPGYSGDLQSVSGTVQIRAATDDAASQTLEWNLEGIDPSCTQGAGSDVTNGCGIHVHSGTSCAVADGVGGHFYSGDTDPWADVVYVASGRSSSGSSTVTTGLKLSEMVGRAFVVHQLESGGRIACGILSSSSLTTRVSRLSTYPGYTGNFMSVSGTVTIRAATDDSKLQTLDWNLEGIDPSCTQGAGDDVTNGCGIHVHSGTTCAIADHVGGHIYEPHHEGDIDPWAEVVYVADGAASSGSSTVMTGMKLSQLAGRAFVVRQRANGTRIACGLLQRAPTMLSVSSGLSAYPGYEGELAVTGVVSITEHQMNVAQILTWDLAGLDKACVPNAGGDVTNGCGIHVHSGMSCDDAGGHYYNSKYKSDPWSEVVYVSDGLGISSSTTTVNSGLRLWDLAGRTFVIHALGSGARIACGTLVAGEMIFAGAFSTYPGYAGTLKARGDVVVASSGLFSQVLSWNLQGVDTACIRGVSLEGGTPANGCGIHVHSGSTCQAALDVGGHLFSSSLESDPWADVTYVADKSGTSAGLASVVTGLTLADQVGHAFVIHQLASGDRAACVLLQDWGFGDDDLPLPGDDDGGGGSGGGGGHHPGHPHHPPAHPPGRNKKIAIAAVVLALVALLALGGYYQYQGTSAPLARRPGADVEMSGRQ